MGARHASACQKERADAFAPAFSFYHAEDGVLRASGTRLAPTEPEVRPWTWGHGTLRRAKKKEQMLL
ncbi:MAG: hypothetical protein IJ733_12545, partial [Lachnospiraceae bacterium]|nr:hypothetical protein [Lachnospiraceae bacterium]